MAGAATEALLFDYGLTLVTFRRPDDALLAAHAEVARRLVDAGLGPVPPVQTLLAEVHDRVERAVAQHDATGGFAEIDVAAEERRAYGALGLQPTDELLDEIAAIVQKAWWDGAVVTPGVVDTLEELRRRGLRLGLCSNAPYRPASLHGQIAHLGLARWFDAVIFSSEVGWRKPSPQIFSAALAALDVEPERCAMVGDRWREDVAGARSAGMATIRTREHRDDPGPDDADAVIDHISELVELLFPAQEGGNRGSVVGDGTYRWSRGTRQETR
ncbi:MAG: HAD family hydrolase [Candidatus Dormibacteria bacterium]|jgi:HAD superfamily hydrolase (TIGR01549 family)